MIRAEMIPDEVVEAAAIAGYEKSTGKTWEKAGYINQQNWRRATRAAIAAALSTWQGAEINQRICSRGTEYLILPLPQELRDE